MCVGSVALSCPGWRSGQPRRATEIYERTALVALAVVVPVCPHDHVAIAVAVHVAGGSDRDPEIRIGLVALGTPFAHAQWSRDVLQPTEFFAGPGSHAYRKAIPDGAGGSFIAWAEEAPPLGMRVQRLDPSGREMWPSGGVSLTSFETEPSRVRLLSDGAGGVMAFWIDSRDAPNSHIYAQRYDKLGNPRGLLP